VLGCNSYHDGRSVFERGLKHIVVRTRAESAHLSWPAAERLSDQIARNGVVRRNGRHGNMAK
jgi:hypothetical protein